METGALASELGLAENLFRDLLVLGVIVVVSVLFGFFFGRRYLVSMLLSMYISVALVWAIPVQFVADNFNQLLAFLIAFLILNLFGRRLFFINILGSGIPYWIKVFLLSFLETVLLVSILVKLAPENLYSDYLSFQVVQYLTLGWYGFAWMVAPLIFVFIIKRSLSR
jgi:hypothetical protein